MQIESYSPLLDHSPNARSRSRSRSRHGSNLPSYSPLSNHSVHASNERHDPRSPSRHSQVSNVSYRSQVSALRVFRSNSRPRQARRQQSLSSENQMVRARSRRRRRHRSRSRSRRSSRVSQRRASRSVSRTRSRRTSRTRSRRRRRRKRSPERSPSLDRYGYGRIRSRHNPLLRDVPDMARKHKNLNFDNSRRRTRSRDRYRSRSNSASPRRARRTNCAHLSFLEFVPRMGVEMVSEEYKSRFVRKKLY